jgi:hypothetical protein
MRTLLTAAVIVSLFFASGCMSLLRMAEEKALKDFRRDLEGLSDEQVATAMEMGVYIGVPVATGFSGVSVLNLIYRDPARMIENYLRYKR